MMKNGFNRHVFEYWTSLLRGRAAPTRSEIQPDRIRSALAYTFILDIEDPGHEKFRLAGTRLCDMYRRELKGKPFASIWKGTEYQAICEIFESMRSECSKAVVTSEIRNAEVPLHKFHPIRTAELETILLPLSDETGSIHRCLGCQVPRDVPHWIGHKDVLPNGISNVEAINDRVVAGFPGTSGSSAIDGRVVQFGRRARIPAGVTGRQVGHLTVIDCEGLRGDAPVISG